MAKTLAGAFGGGGEPEGGRSEEEVYGKDAAAWIRQMEKNGG